MAQLLYGSINYDALLEVLKSGKAKTFKTEKGIRLINVNIWVNDKQDDYGNDASIQVQLKEEHIEKGEKKSLHRQPEKAYAQNHRSHRTRFPRR